MTDIITVFNYKGGVGKTTISVHLAGVLARRGSRVLLADADNQGTAMQWVAQAADDHELPMTTSGMASFGGKLHKQLLPYVDDYDYIVVDCPPATESPCTQSALLVSDVAVVPVIPSPVDFWAISDVDTMLEHARVGNDTLIATCLLNRFDPRRNLARSASEYMEDLPLTPLKAALGAREAFPRSTAIGGLVHDLVRPTDRKAIAEIDSMVDEIVSYCAKTREVA